MMPPAGFPGIDRTPMEPPVKRPSTLVLVLAVAALAIGGLLVAGAGTAGSSADPQLAVGRWLTESGNLEIDIAPCGARLCGTVSKVLSNRSMSDPRKQMTPVDGRSPMGMTILSEFTLDGSVWKGRIYNRENGKTYDCLMTVAGRDTLRIRGYKLLPVLGKTQIWTRVQGTLLGAQP